MGGQGYVYDTMSTNSITCSGSDLSHVLADITARGGRAEAMDTGVVSPAGYRVHYFERARVKSETTVAGPGPVKPGNGAGGATPNRSMPSTLLVGAKPTALTPSTRLGGITAPQGRRDAPPLPHCGVCGAETAPGKPCVICAGLERIRAGARRLRGRFRMAKKEARLPHPND